MRNAFRYDSPLMTGLSKFYRLMMLDALWIIFCIPVFTAGASTTAFYYTIQKNLKYNRGYIWQCFWDCFKSNFKAATKIWLIFLGIGVILALDIGVMRYLVEKQQNTFGVDWLMYVFVVLLILYAVWTFAYVARFSNTTKETLRNSAILAVANLRHTLVILLIIAVTAFVVWLVPITLIILPGVALWFISVFTERVFRANMTEEQRKQEDERNREEGLE